jgi:hypothetical protein
MQQTRHKRVKMLVFARGLFFKEVLLTLWGFEIHQYRDSWGHSGSLRLVEREITWVQNGSQISGRHGRRDTARAR